MKLFYLDDHGSVVEFEPTDDAEMSAMTAVMAGLIKRLRAAEALLLEADACIDILIGDGDNERGRELLAAIEAHWQTYPEPLA